MPQIMQLVSGRPGIGPKPSPDLGTNHYNTLPHHGEDLTEHKTDVTEDTSWPVAQFKIKREVVAMHLLRGLC